MKKQKSYIEMLNEIAPMKEYLPKLKAKFEQGAINQEQYLVMLADQGRQLEEVFQGMIKVSLAGLDLDQQYNRLTALVENPSTAIKNRLFILLESLMEGNQDPKEMKEIDSLLKAAKLYVKHLNINLQRHSKNKDLH